MRLEQLRYVKTFVVVIFLKYSSRVTMDNIIFYSARGADP